MIKSFQFYRSHIRSLSKSSFSMQVENLIKKTPVRFSKTKLNDQVQDLVPSKASPKSKTAVTICRTKQDAQKILKILYANPDAHWACDTEVADIDVKNQSPVGNGKVICASIYGGENIDFGTGSTLWIENYGEADNILLEFKNWFEDSKYLKVWHNYGFDRHVMMNEGINCQGFGGDTMHMARLWDTSRDKATSGGDGYSLATLTETFFHDDDRFIKTSMKEIFGVPKLKKDGTVSKVKSLPDLKEVQVSPEHREAWIEYSARDALATWWLRFELQNQLSNMPWMVDGKNMGNMYNFYLKYWLPFGELLTDMERNGIKVDTKGHLQQAELRAREEKIRLENMFLDWACKFCEDARMINTASNVQIQQLLFGHYENRVKISDTRSFKIEKSESEFDIEKKELVNQNPYALLTAPELKQQLKQKGLKVSGSKSELLDRLLRFDQAFNELIKLSDAEINGKCISRGINPQETKELSVQMYLALEFKELDKKSKNAPIVDPPVKDEEKEPSVKAIGLKKHKEINIATIGFIPDEADFTDTGVPQVSTSVLNKLAGKNIFGEEPIWGKAYQYFGGGEAGEQACRAIGALATMGQVDTTINNFLVPLQALVDKNSRIHCSLNLNTETGRLSSRRPNLQNQPALEKDQYKIRDAFVAEEGKTFIVADYGQLELRILAHITQCKSMIKAFAEGGCFHSRTAVGMYDYIREAVEQGKVNLEWDYSKGQPTVPLVKDVYGSERRKAKTLNFSIAYGKTVHGLASDWGITKEEAEKTLEAWYRDRPEVKKWQERTQFLAKKAGYVRTLMGRYRRLPDASSTGAAVGHALRAAINTPIQGSAADVVVMAMIKLWRSEVLKKLGWKLLLQIHDEVILEGPKETMKEAMVEVRQCMEAPFDDFGLKPLLVHLDVDAKSADSWYKAK